MLTDVQCFTKILQKRIDELNDFLGREELLTEHALHWNYRKIEVQASSLLKRYKKVRRKLQALKKFV